MNTRSLPQDVVYFQNRDYPQKSESGEFCLYSLTVKDSSVCQLRLDFDAFELDFGSDQFSPCDRDSMEMITLSGETQSNAGKLCGHNAGQHMYLEVINEQAQPMIRVSASPRDEVTVTGGYIYNVRVTQIDCSSDNPLRAPEDCLQYMTQRSGTFTSFNFDAGKKFVYSKNQNYAICFRREIGQCQLNLRRSPNVDKDTTSVGNVATAAFMTTLCGPDNGSV